jgi:transient receptor potential cation channel subfamily C
MDFAQALLDHTRSSFELEVLLNHNPTGVAVESGERMHLHRLKLAIKYRQKKARRKKRDKTFFALYYIFK